jgi:hypothetical protein
MKTTSSGVSGLNQTGQLGKDVGIKQTEVVVDLVEAETVQIWAEVEDLEVGERHRRVGGLTLSLLSSARSSEKMSCKTLEPAWQRNL